MKSLLTLCILVALAALSSGCATSNQALEDKIARLETQLTEREAPFAVAPGSMGMPGMMSAETRLPRAPWEFKLSGPFKGCGRSTDQYVQIQNLYKNRVVRLWWNDHPVSILTGNGVTQVIPPGASIYGCFEPEATGATVAGMIIAEAGRAEAFSIQIAGPGKVEAGFVLIADGTTRVPLPARTPQNAWMFSSI